MLVLFIVTHEFKRPQTVLVGAGVGRAKRSL